jgi:hypothetical protein
MKRSITRSGLGFIALAASALALVVAPAALSDRGGNGGNPHNGGGGGGSTSSATLDSSCNPCIAGTYATLYGDGYDASQGAAQVYVSGAWTAIAVAADGTISFSWYMLATGPYDFRIYQKGNGQKMVQKAQLTVTAE